MALFNREKWVRRKTETDCYQTTLLVISSFFPSGKAGFLPERAAVERKFRAFEKDVDLTPGTDNKGQEET